MRSVTSPILGGLRAFETVAGVDLVLGDKKVVYLTGLATGGVVDSVTGEVILKSRKPIRALFALSPFVESLVARHRLRFFTAQALATF